MDFQDGIAQNLEAHRPIEPKPAAITQAEESSMTIIDLIEPIHADLVEDKSQQEILLKRAHSLGHFGGTSMFQALIKQRHTWPGMRKDCISTVQKCLPCQRFNIGTHGFHPVSSIKAQLPFDHTGFDLKEFSLSQKGNKFCLVFVDVATRFVFLRPLPNKEMETVAQEIFKICCDIGFPKICQSDNGREFVNQVLAEICRLAKIDHRLITPYYKQSNGIPERYIQTSANCVYKELESRDDQWDCYVPMVQYSMNIKESKNTKSTPYSLMFARPVNFSEKTTEESDLLDEEQLIKRLEYMTRVVYPEIELSSNSKLKKEGEKLNRKRNLIHFSPGCQVMALDDELRSIKSQPRYTGPFTIVRRNRGGAYILKGPDGTEYKRSPSTLKMYYQPALTEESTFEVGKILDHKELEDGSISYKVKWKNYSDASNSWVHSKDFQDLTLIRKYHRESSKRKSTNENSKVSKRTRSQ